MIKKWVEKMYQTIIFKHWFVAKGTKFAHNACQHKSVNVRALAATNITADIFLCCKASEFRGLVLGFFNISVFQLTCQKI